MSYYNDPNHAKNTQEIACASYYEAKQLAKQHGGVVKRAADGVTFIVTIKTTSNYTQYPRK